MYEMMYILKRNILQHIVRLTDANNTSTNGTVKITHTAQRRMQQQCADFKSDAHQIML